jgi:hypothetical protein
MKKMRNSFFIGATLRSKFWCVNITNIAGSSNGRTRDSGSRYLGSSPSPAILEMCATPSVAHFSLLRENFCFAYPIATCVVIWTDFL